VSAAPVPAAQRFPNVVILTVDTLRLDRVSAYGYRRPTTPNLDRLLAAGVRFTQARTAEPLTNPSLCSLFTSLYPHEHGATRNGLRLRPDAPSLARLLGRRGYTTAAFVGNWTLRNALSGLGDHFQEYHEVLTRKRWLGMFKGEATAEDLSDAALGWLARRKAPKPFLLWVHYVDPHAPYLLHEAAAKRLGISPAAASKSDRYDTEVAFADQHAGRLLAALAADPSLADTIVIFAADHGESLGEHGEWGHGRTLAEPALRIPLGIVWPGHLRPGVVSAAASNLDVAPTLLGLLGLPVPDAFHGFDWAPVLRGEGEPPRERVLWFQAHKGAVLSAHEASTARRKGLLEVGLLLWPEGRKEIFRLPDGKRSVFDLGADPGEERNLAAAGSPASERVRSWLTGLQRGLILSDRLAAAAPVDRESAQKLRSLGYAE
jgi:arylsulfatase A-like enzyme